MVIHHLTSEPAHQLFAKLAASLPGVTSVFGEMAIVERFQLGFKLKQVRKMGWQYDWAQTLTEKDIAQLVTIDRPWHYFKAVCHPNLSNSLQQALSLNGLTAYISPFQKEATVDLSAGWEAYWQTRTHNHKRDLQRRINNLTKTGYSLNTIDHSRHLTEMLTLFFDWHIAYWQQRQTISVYSQSHERQLLTEWLSHLLVEKQLWGMVLMVDNQPVAISLGMCQGDQVYSLLSVYNQDYAKLSPGNSLLYLEMQYAVQQGVNKFWLGPGESFQKSRWQTDIYPTQVMLIPNPQSKMGKLAVAYKLLTHQIEELKTVPQSLNDD